MSEMFLLLATLSHCKVYTLSSPYKWTQPNEIGKWSTGGPVTNRRHSLRLTTERESRDYPFICHRVPYNSSIWNITSSFEIDSGRLHVLFTESFCQSNLVNLSVTTWDGLHLIFHREGKDVIVTMIGSAEFSTLGTRDMLCTIEGPSSSMIYWRMAQTEDGTVFSYIDNTGKQRQCGQSSIKINRGYFTLVGEATDNMTGSSDIFNFAVTPITATKELIKKHDKEKRKIMRAKFESRFEKKHTLSASSGITPEEVLKNIDMDDISKENTILIFQILSEITERVKLNLNSTDLESLVESKVAMKLLIAEHQILKGKSAILDLEKRVDELTTEVDVNLTNIKELVMKELAEVEDSLKDALTKTVKEIDVKKLRKYAKHQNEDINNKRSIYTVMMGICVVECIAFLAFFLKKRKEMHNFKID